MRRLILLALVMYGCAQEPRTTTNTIAPADPRPAPTPSSAIPNRPAVTTTGSPPPASATAPGTAIVEIEAAGIDMRKLLPRGHTVFHIANRTPLAHELTLRGQSAIAATTVAPNGSAVIQMLVGPGPYELVCTVRGHRERTTFDTYVAGTPL